MALLGGTQPGSERVAGMVRVFRERVLRVFGESSQVECSGKQCSERVLIGYIYRVFRKTTFSKHVHGKSVQGRCSETILRESIQQEQIYCRERRVQNCTKAHRGRKGRSRGVWAQAHRRSCRDSTEEAFTKEKIKAMRG